LFDSLLTEKFAQDTMTIIFNLAINCVDEDDALCRAAFDWATRLAQKPAYDSFYLASAELLGADYWTADQRLTNRAHQLGINWVHWMGEPPGLLHSR
jgi:predicted nucleic acid-binding protein